ncbi:MAG: KilA-N domain-containing protein [Scytonematopsis contorta HA4267-MV1]|nr:KilA-N domain-containing protein [Scytonematopsis contorta HA4267-MV1]
MNIIMHEANGLQVGQRHEDGYINATAMCAAYARDVSDWLKTDSAFDLVIALATKLQVKPIPIKNLKSGNSVFTRISATYPTLVVVKRGSPKNGGGTWIHYKLAVPLAMWISAEFALLVSDWVEYWLNTYQNPVQSPASNKLSPLAKAYIESSQALNRTIHTAIHQQTDSLRETLKALEAEDTPNKEISLDITKQIERRLPGEGNGYIHWRTINKNGKDYPQAYYQWRENGKDRTKYIQQQLLGLVEDANEKKRPVIEILRLLGVESGDVELLEDKRAIESESIETSTFEGSRSNSRSNQISPSKIRREKGEGSGSIHWRTITKKGKDYQQPYYHYEFWDDGDCLVKSTRYIPKRLLSQVSRMDREKVPVKEILKVLGVVE